MRFVSKVDSGFALVVAAACLAGASFGLREVARGHAVGWLAVVFLPAVLLLFTWPITYELAASELLIRSGLVLRWRIPLEAIEEVRETRNPLSSPAWSLDRLEVRYRRPASSGVILISPRDKAAFLRELAARVPAARASLENLKA
ncbi:MAG: PH domain-containing protein [Acidobacteria bacterium]|nr:PH domain-containing protein [Acidobacteriota bacterium]